MENTQPIAGTLILGIGNILMGDEGVGVHAVRALEEETLPPGVNLLDGGTAGFNLMEAIESHQRVIMIDATLDGRPPGTIRKIKPRFSSEFPTAMSTHDIGLKDLIEGLSILGRLPSIDLFVVSIDSVQPFKIGLSPSVQNAMPDLKKQILQEIA